MQTISKVSEFISDPKICDTIIGQKISYYVVYKS